MYHSLSKYKESPYNIQPRSSLHLWMTGWKGWNNTFNLYHIRWSELIISVQIRWRCSEILKSVCSIGRSIGQCWWLAGVCWQLHCVQRTLPACRQSHNPLEYQSGKTFNQHVGYFVRVWLYSLPFSRYSVWSWRPLLRRMLQIFHANKLHRFSLLPISSGISWGE
jgi:hypothetical protein